MQSANVSSSWPRAGIVWSVVLVVAGLVLSGAVPACLGQAPSDPLAAVRGLLEHPILEPDQPLDEVRRFCEARIRPLGSYASWGEWQREAEAIRRRVLDELVFVGAARSWRAHRGAVEYLDAITGGEGYRIRKLRYEALPGLWIPALLYEPVPLEGRVPAVLNVNGHDGLGKAAPYKQIRCINQARRGMLALNVEWLGMGQLKADGFLHYRMNQLDLCGTSGLAVFYLCLERALDLLLDHPHADLERTAMAGLSGGGWQTIVFSALDPRVRLANPVAGFSSYLTRVHHVSDLGDSEQTPADLAMTADYTHLVALRAPRPTLLTYNARDDCCFAAGHALGPLVDAGRPIYRLAGCESRLREHVNHDPGTHNFERGNREALYAFLGEYFYPGDASYCAAEIACESELKSAEELAVPLPAENLDFQRLAAGLAGELPRRGGGDVLSRSRYAAPWIERGDADPRARRAAKRLLDAPGLWPADGPLWDERLAWIVRIEPSGGGAAVAQQTGSASDDATQATYWRLSVGDQWTVPLVELSRGDTRRAALVLADGGRTASVPRINRLLDEGYRVLAIDPFYLGESKLSQRDFLYALLVSSAGGRPLGIQAGQVISALAWIERRGPADELLVVAEGPRTSLAALVAVALGKPPRVTRLELHDSLASLKQVIERNWSVDTHPELFAFGLLEHCDIPELIEMAQPCRVERD